MDNCKQCGAALNGAKFCPNCGASAYGEVAQGFSGMPVGADLRQHSLVEMEKMSSYFGAKKQWYDDFETVSEEIAERTERSHGGWIIGAVISVLIGIFAEAIFFYFLAAAFVALFIVLKKKNKDKLAEAVAKQEKIGRDIQAYYEAYGYCSIGMVHFEQTV